MQILIPISEVTLLELRLKSNSVGVLIRGFVRQLQPRHISYFPVSDAQAIPSNPAYLSRFGLPVWFQFHLFKHAVQIACG